MKQILLVWLAALLAAGPAQARPGGEDQVYRPAPGATGHRDQSLDAAVAQVRRETGGRILSAQTVTRDGRRVHRIKVLTHERRVRVIYVDSGS
ncbi:MAG TPA: hypothetical protein ENK49_10520 [Gammaproteobacteria bacterium]|nr:hypothetical protein [Gammaproteobacteria bacterium]